MQKVCKVYLYRVIRDASFKKWSSTVRFGKSPVNRKMVNYFHHFGESNLGTLLSGEHGCERGGVARESLLADTQHSPNSKLLNRAKHLIILIPKLTINNILILFMLHNEKKFFSPIT